MVGAGAWTTCSWSGCGGVSSTRTSTCGGTRRCRSCGRGWGVISRIPTRNVGTRPWTTGRRRRSTRRGGRQVKDVGGEAFFWPRPPAAPVKGGRGQKNALGQGRGGSSDVGERT